MSDSEDGSVSVSVRRRNVLVSTRRRASTLGRHVLPMRLTGEVFSRS